MNVNWVIHYPLFGGPHNRILRLHPYLVEAGIGVTVVLPSEPGNAAERLSDAGVPVRQMSLHRMRASLDPRLALSYMGTLGREVAGLRRIMRETQADAVVVGGLANPHAALAGRRQGIGVIWQVIDTRTPRVYCRAMQPVVNRCADVVMFGAERLIADNFGSSSLRPAIAVLRPSVDVETFVPSPDRRASTRRSLGIPEEAKVVGTVANVIPHKGIEWFVRSAGILAATEDVWFVVVGAYSEVHREYTESIRSEIAALGLSSERFAFTGSRDDVEQFYPAFDVKLVTSPPRSEGTTTTALEALACGVPVVATDIGAVREAVHDGVHGFVVPPEDPAAIAAATKRVLDAPDHGRAMGRDGRDWVVANFSSAASAVQQIAMLDEAAARARMRG